jgi:hypothetical protein
MGRLTAAIAVAAIGAWLVAGAVNAEDRSDAAAPPADPGHEIARGATTFGEGIKHGAEMVGQKIKATAVGVWEAGKAAVNAGSQKLKEQPGG